MNKTFTPDFLESVLGCSTDLIAVIDQAGVYKYVSDSAETLLGYTADELVEKKKAFFVHEDDMQKLKAALQELPSQRSIQMPLYRFRARNGSWRWFEARAINMLENENINGIVTVSRDVTDSLEHENSSNLNHPYFHALYYNHPDSVYTLDTAGYFKKINAPIDRVSGYSEEELAGTYFMNYVHPASHEQALECFRMAIRGESQSAEISIIKKHGIVAVLNLTIVPVFTAVTVVGVQVIAKDITKIKKGEVLVRKQAEQLKNIVESITDPFIVLDEQWRYLYVNSAFAAYLGKDPDLLIGRNIWRSSPELKNADQFYGECLDVAATKKPAYFVETFTGFCNGSSTMSISISPFPGGLSIFGKDISFEKGLQAEFEKLSLVVSKTTNGIFILNNEQKIEWINSGFTRLTGYTLFETLQRKPLSILTGPGTDVATATRIDEKLEQKVPFSEEVLNYKKTGEEIWVMLDVIPILNEDRQVAKFIGILTDITDKKNSEHKLLQLTADLSKQNRDLQQFSYIVSHNLRAPVANAAGLINLLSRISKATPVFDEALAKLKTSMLKLDDVIKDINSILTIRDSSHTTAKEKISLQKILEQVINDLQKRYIACGGKISVDVSEECTIFSNSAYLYNILHSLLGNALKYRAETRPLKVTISCKQYRNAGTVISVSDNGTGMDMDKVKEHIFTLYKRFHPHIEGKGIGLFLVKAQVEALGGRIEVDSKPDVGTTFTIFL